jgi:cyclic pyranopterin phosphate synthase
MLIDAFKRRHDYLRVSLTDRCNLRCIYCMPAEGLECLPHQEVLRNEEFLDLIKLFISMGIRKIRFTGGEPLVRKGFLDIVEETRRFAPDVELAVTTNGVVLGGYIDDLCRLGVRKINISLDTLSVERFEKLTRRDALQSVLANIDKTLEYGFFDVKLNAVLFEETLKELDGFIAYCLERRLVLRFIERMPFTEEDRSAGFTSSDRLLDELARRGELARVRGMDTAVSHCYELSVPDGGRMFLGVIPPMTHKFCGGCNRLRLTADGLLKTCLLSSHEYNLKDRLRGGTDPDELRAMVLKALSEKGDGHHLDVSNADGGCSSLNNSRTMSKIGG